MWLPQQFAILICSAQLFLPLKIYCSPSALLASPKKAQMAAGPLLNIRPPSSAVHCRNTRVLGGRFCSMGSPVGTGQSVHTGLWSEVYHKVTNEYLANWPSDFVQNIHISVMPNYTHPVHTSGSLIRCCGSLLFLRYCCVRSRSENINCLKGGAKRK